MAKKILILTGGPKGKLEDFKVNSERLGMDVYLASFYEIEYIFVEGRRDFVLKVDGRDISDFDIIYIRMVGKRLEDATLVVNYAREKGIKVIDHVYEEALFVPSTISKAMEMKKLIESGISMPETYFGRLSFIREKAPELLKYPYVVKSTSGKKARDTWKIENSEDFEAIFDELRQREKQGIRFFAQKLIRASQRVRVLIIGGKAVGAITRPTKWRKSFIKMQNGEFPEGKKEALIPIPDKYSEIALKATQAADLDISGVDILEEDETGKLYVIEANAAPSWKLIARDCEVNVESEILEYLVKV